MHFYTEIQRRRGIHRACPMLSPVKFKPEKSSVKKSENLRKPSQILARPKEPIQSLKLKKLPCHRKIENLSRLSQKALVVHPTHSKLQKTLRTFENVQLLSPLSPLLVILSLVHLLFHVSNVRYFAPRKPIL